MQSSSTTGFKNKFDIDEINSKALEYPSEYVKNSELEYFKRVEKLSKVIINGGYNIIFIAGPSASGKTTTSQKLAGYLLKEGIKSISISLDDFLKDVDNLPRFEDGSIDFESIDTLDISCFRACINDLIDTKKTMLPQFDFVKQGRSHMKQIHIEDDHLIIVEGLHAMNPMITDCNYSGKIFKVYISVKSEYYSDSKRILNSRNMRLIRRLIRDYHFRGSNAENTLDMWKKACEGENMYIKPFRTSADVWLDSTHLYEPLIYNHYLTPVLQEIKPDSIHYNTAVNLLDILSRFDELDKSIVPENSMLREFIG